MPTNTLSMDIISVGNQLLASDLPEDVKKFVIESVAEQYNLRVCSVTGGIISQGYCVQDGRFYFSDNELDEDAINEWMAANDSFPYNSIEEMADDYDDEDEHPFYYWTDWSEGDVESVIQLENTIAKMRRTLLTIRDDYHEGLDGEWWNRKSASFERIIALIDDVI